MGIELMRRDFLKKVGSIPCLGALGLAASKSSAWGQSYGGFPQPGAVPQITREDLVQLFVGPWQKLRAVIEKKVIDIHCHIGSSNGEELIRSMDIHGIGKAICPKSKASVLAGISYEADLETIAKLPPNRLFVWTQPDNYDFSDPQRAADQVQGKLEAGAKGIGELNVTGYWYWPMPEKVRLGLEPRVMQEVNLENYYPTMEVAEALDVPVFYGVRAGPGAERLNENVGKLADKFPRVNMILGDAGGADYAHGGGWEAIVMAGSYPNLHLEIGRAPVEIIDGAVKYMGPERVLFGTNFTRLNLYGSGSEPPDATTAGSKHWRNLNAVALSNTSEAEKELILYKNAARLLKLEMG